MFNNYCTYRYKKYGKKVLSGDICSEHIENKENTNNADNITSITGPIFGYDLKLADNTSEAGALEKERMDHFEINQELFDVYEKNKVFGIRRSIWVKPIRASHQRQGDDLLLQFTLPKGSYASVLVEELLED